MKKVIWALVLVGLVGVASAAGWQRWKLAQKNALPAGIVSGNGRIESIQVDVAAKYGGRIKEILRGRATWSRRDRSSSRWTPTSWRPSSRRTRRTSPRAEAGREPKPRPRSRKTKAS